MSIRHSQERRDESVAATTSDLKLGVVVPTIAGREESLQRTLDAYQASLAGVEYELVVPKDRPNWPTACNEATAGLVDRVDVIHYGADDLVPLHHWLKPCLPVLAADELPAPRVWNFEVDNPAWAPSQDIDGRPGDLTRFTRVPILTSAMARAIGPWPEIIYYADVWVSLKAHTFGWLTRVVEGYDFVHHWHQTGRLYDEGELAHKAFEKSLELL